MSISLCLVTFSTLATPYRFPGPPTPIYLIIMSGYRVKPFLGHGPATDNAFAPCFTEIMGSAEYTLSALGVTMVGPYCSTEGKESKVATQVGIISLGSRLRPYGGWSY